MLATHRLIDAATALPPVERALLNLWVNRGLRDDRLAQMTGLPADTIAQRRHAIVTGLSEELGLAPNDVEQALSEVAATNAAGLQAADTVAEPAVAEPEAAAVAEPAVAEPAVAERAVADPEARAETSNGHVPNGVVEGPIVLAAEATEITDQPRRRRWFWPVFIAGDIILLIVLALIFVPGSSTKSHSRTTAAVSASTTAAAPTTTAAAAPAPTAPTAPPVQSLGALPGGLATARGVIAISGRSPNLRLKLTVMGLPAERAGHYQVWLYNSILDSQPIGEIRNAPPSISLRLPANAKRYRWIDVSFQPSGVTNHSGESVLRADNPARLAPAALPKKSARHRSLRTTR